LIWDCLRQEIGQKLISCLFGIASQEIVQNLFKISSKLFSFLIDFQIDF